MTARALMNDHPIVLHRTDRLRDAAKLILEHHFRNVPVVDEAGRYLGVVSANGLLGALLPKAATMEDGLEGLPFVRDSVGDLRERWEAVEGLPVTDFLETDLATIGPEASNAETVLTLYRNRTSLPVVDKNTGRLEGIVSHWGVGSAILGRGRP